MPTRSERHACSMDKRNSEGYYDPTASEALGKVAREERAKGVKPCVFICSPYAGDIQRNTQNAKRFMKYAAEKGAVPFVPHLLYPLILNEKDPAQRKLGLSFGLVWLTMCDEMWVFGEHISTGMQTEIDKARACHIPILYFSEDFCSILSKSVGGRPSTDNTLSVQK